MQQLVREYASSLVCRTTGGAGTLDTEAIVRDIRERNLDLEALLRQVVEQISAELEADRGTLFLVDHARGQLVSRVARLPELSEIRLEIGQGIAGWVARHGRTVNQPSPNTDPRFEGRVDAETGYLTRSSLTTPVLRGDTVIGVLQLLNKRGGRFSRWDERRLERLSRDLARILLAADGVSYLLRRDSRHSLFFQFSRIVGGSPVMRALSERTRRAAATEATVLIRGESGTGKELFARAVHDNSRRRDRPFVKVDCAALPAQLIENELFGHERGAYTGADTATGGKVQAADGGTLFLDEIGELPLDVQGKLLRLLQDRTFLKVGGAEARAVDLRFVCATNRDLEAEVAAGRFRQDLYYRLRVVELFTPSLRDRGHQDLDRLIEHFLLQFTARHQRPGLALSHAARARLHAHAWPGNVRELEHCIESAVVLCPEGTGAIDPEHLPLKPAARAAADPASFSTGPRPLREVERDYVAYVLERCGGNRSEAARVLGIGRNTLLRKLKG